MSVEGRRSKIEFPIRSDKLSMSVSVNQHLVSEKSEFQQIDIYDTEVFGRVLLLDGHVQLTTFDEASYHEFLVHVPLLNIAAPQNALVVGGGDGGVIRELCRHDSLVTIDMVEIDERVVTLCQEHLPEVSSNAFDDRRVNLHLTDAFEYVRNTTQKYNIVVVDCTDVYEEEEGELSERLFSQTFYEMVKSCLSQDGYVVTQADNLVFCPYSLSEIMQLFGGVFPHHGSYWSLVPSFGGFSGFVWGSNGAQLSRELPNRSLPSGLRFLDRDSYHLGQSPIKW